MTVTRRATVLALWAAGWAACSNEPPVRATAPAIGPEAGAAPRELRLSGPLAAPSAEISGLATFGGEVIVLPQYPERMAGPGKAAVFAIGADALAAAFHSGGAVTPRAVPVTLPDFAGLLRTRGITYEGFEALTFAGDMAVLTIEARDAGGMCGYLVRGRAAVGEHGQLKGLQLSSTDMLRLKVPAPLANKAYEALAVSGEEVLVFYEVHVAEVNPSPAALAVPLTWTGQHVPRRVPVPAIPYRVTDATPVEPGGQFWALNFYFPGEPSTYSATDPAGGPGMRAGPKMAVERILRLRYAAGEVQIVPGALVDLATAGGLPQNWEGLAVVPGLGFVMATDRYPKTQLAVVALPATGSGLSRP